MFSSQEFFSNLKGTYFCWNRTIGSFSRSLMSSCAPFSLTAGCLRHKSQPTCEKKKPEVEREKRSIKMVVFSLCRLKSVPKAWSASNEHHGHSMRGLCQNKLVTSGCVVRIRIGFRVFVMHSVIPGPFVDVVLIRQRRS